jgi:hypothetical protein
MPELLAPSIGLLELLAPCFGMLELLAPSIGLLELLAPCGGMPELLAPWEVTSMARYLTSGESLTPDCQLSQVDWNFQLHRLVYHNCWLPTERDSFWWRTCIAGLLLMAVAISSVSFLWNILVSQELVNRTITTHRALCGWMAYLWWGAVPFFEGIVCDTAITTSVPCSIQHDASHLVFGGPDPCSPS